MNSKFAFFIYDRNDEQRYYGDIRNRDDLCFIYKKNPFKSKFLNKFFGFSFSQKVNNHIWVFWKKIFFKKLLKIISFNKNEELIFLFHAGWYDKSFIKWLKKKYPLCKYVIYFDDTISCYESAIKQMNHETFKGELDLVLCYNEGDANKYGFKKCSAYFSKDEIIKSNPNSDCDLVFIGQPKDRQKLVEEIYRKVSSKCKCNFALVNGEGNVEGIDYSSKGMSYKDYLQAEIDANCILEIIKGDTDSETLRCWEAVYYNKKLLTNWKGIFKFKYYDERYMKYFESASDLDVNFIKEKCEIDYRYKGDNSPVELLTLVKRELYN